ncbi:MAG TPA: hypothetical protein VFU32_03925 [Ktedonobacterales bacterium]|nr:hypothetical protein [Ktedonobacterales bacterium]
MQTLTQTHQYIRLDMNAFAAYTQAHCDRVVRHGPAKTRDKSIRCRTPGDGWSPGL